MVTDLREEPWLDYIDRDKPLDAEGRAQLRDDAPPDIAESYRLFRERNKDYM